MNSSIAFHQKGVRCYIILLSFLIGLTLNTTIYRSGMAVVLFLPIIIGAIFTALATPIKTAKTTNARIMVAVLLQLYMVKIMNIWYWDKIYNKGKLTLYHVILNTSMFYDVCIVACNPCKYGILWVLPLRSHVVSLSATSHAYKAPIIAFAINLYVLCIRVIHNLTQVLRISNN